MRIAEQLPTRPLVKYHGGKWKIADKILQHLPPHRVYVEPFGGGASVLLRKPRSQIEVYNDLDGEMVNLFRVARDRGDELASACELTSFAREEFELSYQHTDDELERARRTIVRSYMGFGSAGIMKKTTGFASGSPSHAKAWANYPDHMRVIVQRLRGVIIEHRDAIDVMRAHDSDTTAHYVDPPYVHRTRFSGSVNQTYRHELSDDQHRALADVLHDLRGPVIVSGYRCDIYDDLFGGWRRLDFATHADGARPRVESIWLSPRCPDAGLF